MNRPRFAPALLLLLVLAPVPALSVNDGFWCGQRIVEVGDPIWEVARRCPEPFWRESYDRPAAFDRQGHALGFERVEVWALNFGPSQFMRELRFVNGRLSRARNLGYGVAYEPGSRDCGPHELSEAGDTIAEVFARCGAPDHSYELSAPAYHGYYGPAARQERRRVWAYEFGSRRQARELLFVNGRLLRTATP